MSTTITNNKVVHTRGDTLLTVVDLFWDKERTRPYYNCDLKGGYILCHSLKD